MSRAILFGLLSVFAFVQSSAHAQLAESPHVAMCKRDAKNLVDDIGRTPKNQFLERAYGAAAQRVGNFEVTCISGPKAMAVKSAPGYADVTALHTKMTEAIVALKKQVDELHAAEAEDARKRTEQDQRERAEKEKRDQAWLTEQRRQREAERTAEAAQRVAEERAYREKKAKEHCTQNGQLAKTCYAFLILDREQSRNVELEGYVRSCLERATSSPDVSAAEQVLAAGVTHEYASECLRMMDVAQGVDWRKPVELRKKREVFAKEIDTSMRKNFPSKCGVAAWLEGPTTRTVVLEKNSTRKGIFLSKKDPEGDVITIHCSGVIVTQYASGGSRTSQPKTEAGLSAERELRACAIEKARYLCRGGKIDFERGVTECVRAAESACR